MALLLLNTYSHTLLRLCKDEVVAGFSHCSKY